MRTSQEPHGLANCNTIEFFSVGRPRVSYRERPPFKGQHAQTNTCSHARSSLRLLDITPSHQYTQCLKPHLNISTIFRLNLHLGPSALPLMKSITGDALGGHRWNTQTVFVFKSSRPRGGGFVVYCTRGGDPQCLFILHIMHRGRDTKELASHPCRALT